MSLSKLLIFKTACFDKVVSAVFSITVSPNCFLVVEQDVHKVREMNKAKNIFVILSFLSV